MWLKHQYSLWTVLGNLLQSKSLSNSDREKKLIRHWLPFFWRFVRTTIKYLNVFPPLSKLSFGIFCASLCTDFFSFLFLFNFNLCLSERFSANSFVFWCFLSYFSAFTVRIVWSSQVKPSLSWKEMFSSFVSVRGTSVQEALTGSTLSFIWKRLWYLKDLKESEHWWRFYPWDHHCEGIVQHLVTFQLTS